MKKKVQKLMTLLCIGLLSLNTTKIQAAAGNVYDEDIAFTKTMMYDTSGKYQDAIFNGNILFGTNFTELQKFFNKMFTRSIFNKPVVFSGNLKIIGADNPTYGEMFAEANFNQGIVLEEGIEIIRGYAFNGAKDLTRKLILPDSLKKLYGQAFENTNYQYVSVGPNLVLAQDYSLYHMKSLDILEFREGCEDFYVYDYFYWGDHLSGEIKLYLPRTFNPYSSTFYRDVTPTTTTTAKNNKELFNYSCEKYNLMPYVWADSQIRQYFDENGIEYRLRDGGSGDDESEGGTPEGGTTVAPVTPGSGVDTGSPGESSGDSTVVEGFVFEVEDQMKIVPSTSGFKKVGPTLEAYKSLLQEVDSSYKNKGLRRVTNFIQRFGSSFNLLFKK